MMNAVTWILFFATLSAGGDITLTKVKTYPVEAVCQLAASERNTRAPASGSTRRFVCLSAAQLDGPMRTIFGQGVSP